MQTTVPEHKFFTKIYRKYFNDFEVDIHVLNTVQTLERNYDHDYVCKMTQLTTDR